MKLEFDPPRSAEQIADLAERWIDWQLASQKDPKLLDVDDPRFQAWEELNALMGALSPLALEVCVQIGRRTKDKGVLSVLGAGPLEDLLVGHPDEVLATFKTELWDNPGLQFAMGCIWPQGVRPDAWDRIESLRRQYGIDPHGH